MSFKIRRHRKFSTWGRIPVELTLADVMKDLVGR